MQQVHSKSDTFTEFVRTAEPRLRNAFVSSYGHEIGRDAAAEALAYAWENWERIEMMENPIGYLYRVGRSRSRTMFRKTGPLPRPTSSHMPWIEPALPHALEALSLNQRRAVLLVKGFGWSYREVAELLGTSLGTVQKHVDRGLAKLRASLEVSIDV